MNERLESMDILLHRYTLIDKQEFFHLLESKWSGTILVVVERQHWLGFILDEICKEFPEMQFTKKHSGWLSKTNAPLIRFVPMERIRLVGYPQETKAIIWDLI